MANTGGKITEQVDISDISTVLGVASNAMSVLATHSNINIWAKNKPVKLAKEDALIENDRFYQNAEQTHYGIKPVTVSANHPIALYNAVVSNNGKGFIYVKPVGGDSSPYRMGDFSNYNHYAPILFGTADIHNTSMSQDPTYSCDLYLDFFTKQASVEINPNLYYDRTANLHNNNIFLGVMLMNSAGTVLGWNAGAYEQFDDKGNPIDIPADLVRVSETGQNLYAFFFVVNTFKANYNNNNLNNNARFIAIPNDANNPNPCIISISRYNPPTPSFTVKAYVDIQPSGNKSTMYVSIEIIGETQCPATNAAVTIYNTGGSVDYVLQIAVPTITSTWTYEERLDIPYSEIGNYTIGYPYDTH